MISTQKLTTIVPYQVFLELKNKKYNLDKDFNNRKIKEFDLENLDEGVMFFDEELNYIDPKRFEMEDIKVSYVLLPRFIWLNNLSKLEDFTVLDNNLNKINLINFLKIEEEYIENYGLKNFNNDQTEKLQEMMKTTGFKG